MKKLALIDLAAVPKEEIEKQIGQVGEEMASAVAIGDNQRAVTLMQVLERLKILLAFDSRKKLDEKTSS